MADDTSNADTSISDDDIADEPLFGSTEPVTADTEAEPSTTEETAETKGSETEETTEEETDTEAKDTEATEQTDEAAQITEEPGKGRPDPALAREAYLERQRTRQAVEQKIDTAYAPKTEEQLVEEGLDPQTAQIQALREEMQYERQKTYIAELNAGMQAEAVNVEHDFPVFNPKSPEYDPDFTKMVETQYQTAARLQVDENGIILNAEIPLYEFHKQMADIYNRGASKGSAQGQKEALQTLSRTEAVGSSSTTSRGPETLEEMGERLANLPLI